MMRHFCLLIVAITCRADSLLTSDNLTLHGTVFHMDKEQVHVHARFSSGPQDVPISRARLVSIEINSNTFNTGGPDSYGLKPGEAKQPAPPDNSTGGPDLVILRGGDRKNCGTVTIDDRTVHCGKTDYDRNSVVRILLK